MAVRRNRFSRSSAPRRQTAWSASDPASGFTPLAGSTTMIFQIATPTVLKQTIVRIRGMFAWRTDQEIANENQVLSYGICVVEEPAATIGATAVPSPGVDSGSDVWMYHQYVASRFNHISGVGFDASGDVHMVQIDSKAMRIVEDNQRILFMFENQGSAGIQVLSQTRILSKLS